jgi:hypothetical protein
VALHDEGAQAEVEVRARDGDDAEELQVRDVHTVAAQAEIESKS